MTVVTKNIAPEELVQSFLMGSKQSQSGQRRLELLNKIESLGSLSAAAKACEMSYKGAWQALEAMNQLAETPLVVTQKGGAGGGGMVLTSEGQNLLAAYRLFREQMQHWMRHLEQESPAMLNQLELMRKIAMKTSARNLLHGTVSRIDKGAVNCEVALSIGGGNEVIAQITLDSLERLALDIGSDAFALIKASWVILSEDNGLKTSARNQFTGVVSRLEKGAVNADVSLDLPGQQVISAVVSNASVDALSLEVGQPCCALVKANHVLLAVSD